MTKTTALQALNQSSGNSPKKLQRHEMGNIHPSKRRELGKKRNDIAIMFVDK